MIDFGLLASIAFVLAIPALFVRPFPPSAVPHGVIDTALGALAAGLIVGRLTSLALDDPGSLTKLGDILIIRSGVEFWPGVAAGLGWLAVGARREATPASVRIAALAPAALVGWACYEATCLLRDGCPGPASQLGAHPDGLTTRMFPVGLAVAFAAMCVACILERAHRRGLRSTQVGVMAVASVAAIRSVASIWLPHIGDGLTRQHKESIAVFAVSSMAVAVMCRHRRRDVTQTAASR
ncbi:MAG: hypothetical protein ABIQ39_06275 [Ilumatobacteraceae bacterium]